MTKKHGFIPALIFLLVFSSFGQTGSAKEEEKEKAEAPPAFAPGPNPTPTLIPKYPEPSIVEIQKQLQDLATIQRTLQFQHQQNNIEIQRIVEQTRVHQRILQQLSLANTPGVDPSREEINRALHREKVRLIEEQARKNQAALAEQYKEDRET